MKSKLRMICLLSIMAFGISACGGSNAADEGTGIQISTETVSEDTASFPTDAEHISDRQGYVGYEDLDIDAYVELNDYKNMKVTVYKHEIKDADIEQYICGEILKGDITDRPVEKGDVVNIDYEIGKDGVALDDSMASGMEVEIGSGTLNEGFEEGLIGAMPGELVRFEVTLPEEYPEPMLAGQTVEVLICVNSITGTIMEYAEMSDADLERLGLPYENKEMLWEAAKTAVEKNAQEDFEASKENAIISQVLSESTIKSVPEYLVEELIQETVTHMESMSRRYYGADFEQFLQEKENTTLDDFVEQLRPDCERRVKEYLILEALARAEKIEITDDLLREYAQEDIQSSDSDMEAFMEKLEPRSRFSLESSIKSAMEAPNTADKYIEEVGYTLYRMDVLQEVLMERLDDVIALEIIEE